MTKHEREDLIMWLEVNRQHGAFEGFPEENMNFSNLSDDELLYYIQWKI